MNEIVNKFLLAGDKFKNKERIQKFKETGDTSYIAKMNLIRHPFNTIWLMVILKI